MTASHCTAPVEGHRKPGPAVACPAHGPTAGARSATESGRLAPSTFNRVAALSAAQTARALVDATDDPEDRALIAADPDTAPEALALLADDWDGPVRDAVANNPNAPLDVLVRLSRDEEHWTRKCVAEHPNAPVETLIFLSRDENKYVRDAVAEHPSTPREVLARLARDEDRYVRRTVAKNPHTPPAAYMLLLADKAPSVAEVAVAASVRRICAMFGIDESNTQAIDMLRDQAWWDMTDASPAVILAKALSPNA